MKKLIVLLFALSTVNAFSQTTDEKKAIVKVLEKEAATWRSGDVKAHADCWQVQPYSRILVSVGDSTALDVPPALMVNPPEGMLGKGGSAVMSNIKINASGNNAWVSHNEVSTSAEGKKSYSYEIRILEKINGQWKLVGQSIHVYKPKQ